MIMTVASVGGTRWISVKTCFIAWRTTEKIAETVFMQRIFRPLFDYSDITSIEMQILQLLEGFLCNKLFFAGTTISEVSTYSIEEILQFRRRCATGLIRQVRVRKRRPTLHSQKIVA